MKRLKTEYIVIHCSDSYPSMDIGVKEIRRWHTSPDKNDPSKPWKDIGYHFVIRRNGIVEVGRHVDDVGSHTRGFNSDSIGICMVGGKDGNNFTVLQWGELETLVRDLKKRYNKPEVVGHCELNAGKTCPNFDVQQWLKTTGV